MAKVKHKNKSTNYHTSRTRTDSSSLSLSRNRDNKIFATARLSILTVIILASMTVILALLINSFTDPEKIIIKRIDTIVSDYYENYFYENVAKQSTKPLAEVLSIYKDAGFSPVSLKQILLSKDLSHTDTDKILSTYCDTEDTFIQFFPDPPFGRTDYHVDYRYSCTF